MAKSKKKLNKTNSSGWLDDYSEESVINKYADGDKVVDPLLSPGQLAQLNKLKELSKKLPKNEEILLKQMQNKRAQDKLSVSKEKTTANKLKKLVREPVTTLADQTEYNNFDLLFGIPGRVGTGIYSTAGNLLTPSTYPTLGKGAVNLVSNALTDKNVYEGVNEDASRILGEGLDILDVMDMGVALKSLPYLNKLNKYLPNTKQLPGSGNALNLEELRRAYHNSERFLQPEESRFLHKHGHGLRENYRTNMSNFGWGTNQWNANNQLPPPPSEIQFMPDGTARTIYNQQRIVPTPEGGLFGMTREQTEDVWRDLQNNPYWNTQNIFTSSSKPKTIINKSGLTKEEVLQKASGKDKDVVSKMSESDFENTVLKPTGEVVPYESQADLMPHFTGTNNVFAMSPKQYADEFNSRLDLLNDIIAQKNKSGVNYTVKGLDENGMLTFYTPEQNIFENLTNAQKASIELFKKNPKEFLTTRTGLRQEGNKWIMRDGETFNSLDEAINFTNNEIKSATASKKISGESRWSTRLNPGQWRGNVEDIANTEYYRSIPGIEMSNTTSGVFADNVARKGTGAYESINEYLKRSDLGRVKPGFNSQTEFSRGAWENFIKSGRGVGFYANPRTVYGTMKSIFPYLGTGYLGYEGLQGTAINELNKETQEFSMGGEMQPPNFRDFFGKSGEINQYPDGGLLPKAQYGFINPSITLNLVPALYNKFLGKNNPVKANVKNLSKSFVQEIPSTIKPTYESMREDYLQKMRNFNINLSTNDSTNYDMSNAINLTSGRFKGATVSPELINEAVQSAKAKGIDPWLMLSVIGRESTFGSGDITNVVRKNSKRGLLSGWNVSEPYEPYDPLRFFADKKAPGINVGKSAHGWFYDVNDETALNKYLTQHPELVAQYQQKISATPLLGDLDSFDLAAKMIKEKGLKNYNAGDPKYLSMVNQDMQLLKSDSKLKEYMKKLGYKNGGKINQYAEGGKVKDEIPNKNLQQYFKLPTKRVAIDNTYNKNSPIVNSSDDKEMVNNLLREKANQSQKAKEKRIADVRRLEELNQKSVLETANAKDLYDIGEGMKSKYRFSNENNFFDDNINPFNIIGGMAGRLAQTPELINQGDYTSAALAIAAPLAVGAIGGIGANTQKQFLNNTFNPVAASHITHTPALVAAKIAAKKTLQKQGASTYERGGKVKDKKSTLSKLKKALSLKENLGNLDTKEGYFTPLNQLLKTAVGMEGKDYSNESMEPIAREQDALRMYLGLPTKTGAFEQTGPNKYRIRDYNKLYPDTLLSDEAVRNWGVPNEDGVPDPVNPAFDLYPYDDFVMGKHYVTKGKDAKGEYLKYSDRFDFDPTRYANQFIDRNVNPNVGKYLKKATPLLDELESLMFNPFELEDKIYYDPKTKLRSDIILQQNAPKVYPGQPMAVPAEFKSGGKVNDNKGYLISNLDNFTPKKIINSNYITTNNMAFPVEANGVVLYPNTGNYLFPTDKVTEIPIMQNGSSINNDMKKKLKKYQGGGYLNYQDSYKGFGVGPQLYQDNSYFRSVMPDTIENMEEEINKPSVFSGINDVLGAVNQGVSQVTGLMSQFSQPTMGGNNVMPDISNWQSPLSSGKTDEQLNFENDQALKNAGLFNSFYPQKLPTTGSSMGPSMWKGVPFIKNGGYLRKYQNGGNMDMLPVGYPEYIHKSNVFHENYNPVPRVHFSDDTTPYDMGVNLNDLVNMYGGRVGKYQYGGMMPFYSRQRSPRVFNSNANRASAADLESAYANDFMHTKVKKDRQSHEDDKVDWGFMDWAKDPVAGYLGMMSTVPIVGDITKDIVGDSFLTRRSSYAVGKGIGNVSTGAAKVIGGVATGNVGMIGSGVGDVGEGVGSTIGTLQAKDALSNYDKSGYVSGNRMVNASQDFGNMMDTASSLYGNVSGGISQMKNLGGLKGMMGNMKGGATGMKGFGNIMGKITGFRQDGGYIDYNFNDIEQYKYGGKISQKINKKQNKTGWLDQL